MLRCSAVPPISVALGARGSQGGLGGLQRRRRADGLGADREDLGGGQGAAPHRAAGRAGAAIGAVLVRWEGLECHPFGGITLRVGGLEICGARWWEGCFPPMSFFFSLKVVIGQNHQPRLLAKTSTHLEGVGLRSFVRETNSLARFLT